MIVRTKGGDLLIFGIKSGDLIGIIGFALAIFANGWLIKQYLTGAEVTMYPPEQIDLRCSRTERGPIFDDNGELLLKEDGTARTANYCTKNASVSLAAHALAYSNDGADGYHAVIKKETVFADVILDNGDPESLTLYWQYFVNLTDNKIDKTVAVPVMVKGGEAIAHETQFYRRFYSDKPANSLSWEDLITLIQRGKVSEIRLRFEAEILGDSGTFEVGCTLPIDERVQDLFKEQGLRRFQHTFSCES